MAFTKIRFTSNVWNPKTNAGTSWCQIKTSDNRIVFEKGNWICNTVGTAIHDLPTNFTGEMHKISFTRYIDTRSFGNASMKVDLFDSLLQVWINVFNLSTGYRTGPGWETHTWNISSKYPYAKPNEKIKNIKVGNNTLKLSTIKWGKSYFSIPYMNELYLGKFTKTKPNFPTITAIDENNKYYLINSFPFKNYTLNKNYTYQTVEKGSFSINNVEKLKLGFECTSRPEGSHKGNNGGRTGNIILIVKNKSGKKLINETFVMWDYLGGDAKKNINYYFFYNNTFYEPVDVEISWELDVGYYVAHIWGERYGVSVIDHLKLTIDYGSSDN